MSAAVQTPDSVRCGHCRGRLFREMGDDGHTPPSYVCINCGRRKWIAPVTQIRRDQQIDLGTDEWTAVARSRTGDTIRFVWSDTAHMFQVQIWGEQTWGNDRLIRPRELGRALQGYCGRGALVAFQDKDGLVQPIQLGES